MGATAALASAVVATVAWELAVQPRPRRSLGAAVRGLRGELEELPAIFDQAIGVFGWLDTRMPTVAYGTWKVLLLALLAAAFVVGGRRQRLALGILAAGTVVATVAVATLNRATGFGAQARYVLPYVVVLPLAAGEVLVANRDRVRARLARWLPVAFVVPTAAVHLLAWYTNARRHAVGVPGPWAFIAEADWNPPLGWWTWLGVTAAATAALVVAAVLAARNGPGGPVTAAARVATTASDLPGSPVERQPGRTPPGRPAPAPHRDGW